MKMSWILLVTVAFGTGAALAQVCPPTALAPPQVSTTTTVTSGPMIGTTVVPMAMAPTAMSASSEVTVVCPSATIFPEPCAAKSIYDISGNPVVLVLGSEENFALRSMHLRHINWEDVSANSMGLFTPGNPLTSNQPNGSITRHGNPYYPYYAVYGVNSQVAGSIENYPINQTTSSTNPLDVVKNRFNGLTEQQAISMGYQPLSACLQNVGQLYVNRTLIDNTFDPMEPEAFSFDRNGHVLAVHYILLSDQPFSAFGQAFQPSPIVQGAGQLTVWLYLHNPSGLFSFQNPRVKC
jgi:hypothetical protein